MRLAREAALVSGLSRKLALKGRSSLFLLLLSAFAVSFIFIVSMSFLMSLQSDQLSVIRDALDFDFQIPYESMDEDGIKGMDGVDSVHLCKDIRVFGTDSGTMMTKRFCSADLFGDVRFSKCFEHFPALRDGSRFMAMSAFASAVGDEKMFYVSKGRNGRASVFADDAGHASFFSSPYAMLDSICFENMFAADREDADDLAKVEWNGAVRSLNPKIRDAQGLYYGVYASSPNALVRRLRRLGIPFKTYKDISKSVYSALIIERVVFFAILLLLLAILVVLICRLFFRFLQEDKKKAAILVMLGMEKNAACRVFSAPCVLLTFASLVAGCAAGCLFISSERAKSAVFALVFGSSPQVALRVLWPVVWLYLLLSLVLTLLMHYVMTRNIGKMDVMEMVKAESQ